MKVRKSLVGAAAAVLALSSAAWADSTAINSQPDSSTFAVAAPDSYSNVAVGDTTAVDSQPVMADDAPARAPLMAGLDKIGAASWLDKAGINIYGFVEVGYFYDLTSPNDVSPAKFPASDAIYFPGPYKQAVMLNQLDLSFERAIDASKGKFDVGFKVEGVYGRDAYYIHSNGVLDETNKAGGVNGPFDQLDLEQAYVTVAIPVGTGLTLKAGKFDTLLGYEVIQPTGNTLYTHSYGFSFGVPLTQTGILASYNLTDKLSVTAGITRGWNQTLYDNNGAIDFLGEASYTATDKLTLIGNLGVGPEVAHDNAHYDVVPEAIAEYKASDQLTLGVDVLYGLANSYGQWYGTAGYASYTLDKWVTLNGRGEYYHDGNDFTTGAPDGGATVNYFEATAGVAITPMPDNTYLSSLTVRPEMRVDWADHGVYDDGHFSEVTFAIDATVKF